MSVEPITLRVHPDLYNKIAVNLDALSEAVAAIGDRAEGAHSVGAVRFVREAEGYLMFPDYADAAAAKKATRQVYPTRIRVG